MNAIRLEKVSKKFRRYSRPRRPTTLKSVLVDLIRGRRGSEDGQYLWALKDIDLEVPQGTTLGIIGRNGSGKSTLLKILAGIYRPNSGKVEINGRVSALIELGAGFHPELSGRENIFVNGMILGLSRREIRQKFDEIVAFAELEDFIDAPVRTYSSGMYMRLGFSVAVYVDPEILLIDEVLAVGDERFQSKCLQMIKQFQAEGKTIVFVSHALEMIEKHCDIVMLLEDGRNVLSGAAAKVIMTYRSANKEYTDRLLEQSMIQNDLIRFGNQKAEIGCVSIIGRDDRPITVLMQGEAVRVRMSVVFHAYVASPIIGFTLRDHEGAHVSALNTSQLGLLLPPGKAGSEITVTFDVFLPILHDGSYSISPAVADGTLDNHVMCDWLDKTVTLRIEGKDRVYGLWRPNASVQVEPAVPASLAYRR